MRGDSRRGSGVNACKTLVGPKNTRSATRLIVASRFELPLLGSNQDSPDPESGVLPVTPRGTGTALVTSHVRALDAGTAWSVVRGLLRCYSPPLRKRSTPPSATTHHSPPAGSHGAEGLPP